MSYEIWRGPSELDGATEIVLLVSGASTNRKTGDQLQTWILRTDIPPHHAVKQGLDAAVCGDCLHRAGSCYVLPFTSPNQVWKSWIADPKPVPTNYTLQALVRLGAYGEIPAVPFEVIAEFLKPTKSSTGFTHAWRYCDQRYQDLLMASVETNRDAREAQAMGWRTYRTTDTDWHLTKGEILCPGSDQADHKLTCAQCGYCDGNARKLRGNVVAPVHGANWKIERFRTALRAKQPQQSRATMENQREVITWL